jgi:hypothetical protein
MIGYLRHHRVLIGLVFAVWAFLGVVGDIDATYHPAYQFYKAYPYEVCTGQCYGPALTMPAEFDVALFVYRLLWMLALAVLMTVATLAVVELIRRSVRALRGL